MTATAHRDAEIGAAILDLSHVDEIVADERRYMSKLARRSVALSSSEAAAVLVADVHGVLSVAGATTNEARLLLVTQLDHGDGPSMATFRDHCPNSVPDLRDDKRWPVFRGVAQESGFASVHTIPLRHHEDAVGVLTLYGRRPGPLPAHELTVVGSLALLATGLLLVHRALHRSERLTGQLQTALQSRITIEQAKGVLAERHALPVDGAFEMMRRFARHARIQLDRVAHAVVENSPLVADLGTLTVERAEG